MFDVFLFLDFLFKLFEVLLDLSETNQDVVTADVLLVTVARARHEGAIQPRYSD